MPRPLPLWAKRLVFSRMLGEWLVWMYRAHPINAASPGRLGVRLVQFQRTEAEARANAAAGTGIVESLHRLLLAIDTDLWLDGRRLTNADNRDWAVYEPGGLEWERLGGAWGGRFPNLDVGHLSLPYGGRR